MKKRVFSFLLTALMIVSILPITASAMCYPDWDNTKTGVEFAADGSKVQSIRMNYRYYDDGGMNDYYYYNVAFLENAPVAGDDYYVSGPMNWSSVIQKMNTGGNSIIDESIKNTVGFVRYDPVVVPFDQDIKGTEVNGNIVFDSPDVLSQLDPGKRYTAVLLCTHTNSSCTKGGTFYTGVNVKFSLENYTSASFKFNGLGGTDFALAVKKGNTVNNTATTSNPDYIAMSDATKAIVDNFTPAVTAPVEDGYLFRGWYTDAGLTESADFDAELTKEVTYYAKWLPIHKITYSGDSNITFSKYGSDELIESAAGGDVVKFAVKAAEGYQVKSVTAAASGKSVDVSKKNGCYTFTMPEGDVTVNAVSERISHTVDFDMNKHGKQIDAQNVEYGDKAVKPDDPAALGYTFGGWYEDPTCSIKFDFDSAITEDTIIYAKWTKNSIIPPAPEKYIVAFDMQGHGKQVDAQNVEYGDKAVKPDNPAAKGYTFGGWYIDEECTTAFDFNQEITRNTTVYAKWTRNAVVPAVSSSPKTGDDSNMFIWSILLLINGIALAASCVYRKRKIE